MVTTPPASQVRFPIADNELARSAEVIGAVVRLGFWFIVPKSTFSQDGAVTSVDAITVASAIFFSFNFIFNRFNSIRNLI
jgi:hypothetical protein